MSSQPPWDHLITFERVLYLHAEGIQRYGGDMSPPAEGCIERSLGGAFTAEQYFHTDTESLIEGLCFCAHVLLYLARNHCFSDGNKRVAWLCATQVLLKLGLTLDVSNDEAEAFCLRIADSQRPDTITDGSEVIEWMAARLQAVS